MSVLLVLSAITGCGAKSTAVPEASATDHTRSSVERGPVRVTAEMLPVRPRLSDSPTLTLTIDCEEGVTVEKPLFGESIGRFAIRDTREPLPKTNNGRVIVQQVFTLEPTEAGRLRIDPIAVSFTDRRPEGDNVEHTIETEPLSIEVTSLLGEKTPTLNDLHPPIAPMALASRVADWIWAIAAVVLAAVAVLAWRKRHRQRAKAVAVRILTPEELANLELDKLMASGLAVSDIKQFYVELTAIVRRYIERTTGIRAPEQTTEEFLREISRRGSVFQHAAVRVYATDESAAASPTAAPTEGGLWDERSRLRDFLESADLVKFAAHHPNTEDVDESVRRARLFIGAKGTQS